MDRLKGKVAVITGGSSGIGAATARLFHQEGAKVAIFGRTDDEMTKLRQEIGDDLVAVAGDVSKLDDLERLFMTTHDASGRSTSFSRMLA